MELTTLNPDRNYRPENLIDEFESAIWTERYFGDGDFTLTVPVDTEGFQYLTKGTLLQIDDSDVPMILETRDIKDGILKATGIELTKWTNNRIIRTTSDHSVKEWVLTGRTPGQAISDIVTNFLMSSPYLNGTINIGIPTFQVVLMPLPGLMLGDQYLAGAAGNYSVPFGPVYDAVRAIAEPVDIGLRIRLYAYEDYFMFNFDFYKGDDRTSDQTILPTIRFSPDMETFSDITDLESIADHKNWVYAFAGTTDMQALGPTAGWAWSYAPPEQDFNLRVAMTYADNLDPAVVTTVANLNAILQQKANEGLVAFKAAKLVDGEIIQTGQINYGTDYFLGDVVEVEGNTGIRQNARITEWIRSKDASGERAYPGLTMID